MGGTAGSLIRRFPPSPSTHRWQSQTVRRLKKLATFLDGGNGRLTDSPFPPKPLDSPLAKPDGSPLKKVSNKIEKRVSPESESFHRHYPRLSGWSFKPAMKPS